MADSNKTIIEPSQELPIIGEFDVVVCGGGPAGCTAAIAAARNGARTLLIEKNGYLGGATVSQLVVVILSTNGVDFEGLWHDHMARLAKTDSVRFEPQRQRSGFWGSVDPERVKFVWDDMVSEAGADQLLHCHATRPLIEERSSGAIATGLCVETVAGRRAILAKRIIDATADGIVCAQAGISWEQGDGRNPWAMSCTKVYRVGNVRWPADWPTDEGVEKLRSDLEAAVERGEFDAPVVTEVNRLVNYIRGKHWRLPEYRPEIMSVLSRVLRVDTLDPFDVTRAEREGREQARQGAEAFRRFVPGQEQSYLLDTSADLGIRSSRRIRGIESATNEDAVKLRKHKDGVARCSFGIDVWPADSYSKKAGDDGGADAYTIVGESREIRDQKITEGDYFDIRYGALVASGVDNILTAGRCISADHFAESALRLQQTCMSTGEAAGTIAALSVKNDVTPREMPSEYAVARLNETRAGVKPAFDSLRDIPMVSKID